MASSVAVTIHPSQFPGNVRRALLESLRSRRVNHKFHYESYKQGQKWLALHEAYSPVRTRSDVAAIYQRSFAAAVMALPIGGGVHVIGLGCGGGQKEAELLKRLRAAGRTIAYTPCDVSLPLVLTAQAAALEAVGNCACFPLVCDLAETEDLVQVLDELVRFSHTEPENQFHLTQPPLFGGEGNRPSVSNHQSPAGAPHAPSEKNAEEANRRSGYQRLFTFFGMLPNFEPEIILPRLAGLLRPGDRLLLSANLAPGNDYATGVQQILPQYDNELTRDWLLTFLLDLGIDKADGQLEFVVEEKTCANIGLKRIAAYFHFKRTCEIRIEGEEISFSHGDKLRLFFSYRHTRERVRDLLQAEGVKLGDQWIADSGEEGVFALGALS